MFVILLLVFQKVDLLQDIFFLERFPLLSRVISHDLDSLANQWIKIPR